MVEIGELCDELNHRSKKRVTIIFFVKNKLLQHKVIKFSASISSNRIFYVSHCHCNTPDSSTCTHRPLLDKNPFEGTSTPMKRKKSISADIYE